MAMAGVYRRSHAEVLQRMPFYVGQVDVKAPARFPERTTHI